MSNSISTSFFKFLIVAGLNAAIYFAILMALIALSGNYYLSVGLSQVCIAIIAYVNFSRFHYKSKLAFKTFLKFSILNILLFLASTVMVWATSSMHLHQAVFGLINLAMIAPLSYIFNTNFIFNKIK